MRYIVALIVLGLAGFAIAQTYEKGKDGKVRQVFSESERVDRLAQLKGLIAQDDQLIEEFNEAIKSYQHQIDVYRELKEKHQFELDAFNQAVTASVEITP